MHIKILLRKALCVFLSVIIVLAGTQSAFANSAGWALQSTLMSGATASMTAIKGAGSTALKSVITHTPSAAAVGRQLIKGAGSAALAYAMVELLDSGIDWVLDPANNGVRYKTPSAGVFIVEGGGLGCNTLAATPQGACAKANIAMPLNTHSYNGTGCQITASQMGYTVGFVYSVTTNGATCGVSPENEYTIIPIETVGAKVLDNALAGHSPSRDLARTAAIDDFSKGVLNPALEANAIPVTDVNNPPVTDPNNPQVSPFDPSSIIAALKSVVTAINDMSSSIGLKLFELIGMEVETQRVINEGMDNVVAANDRTGVKVGEIVAAIEAMEGNTLTGEVINEAIDRAISEGKTSTAEIVAAIEAIEGNTLTGEVINQAVDRVIADNKVNEKATQDKITEQTDRVVESTDGVKGAVEDLTGSITEVDEVTGERALKLPAFCGFAPVVCEYVEFVKGEYQAATDFFTAPNIGDPQPVEVGEMDIPNWQDKANAGYVRFDGQCPADVQIPISYMGASTTLNLSYIPFCHFASIIKYAVIFGANIAAMMIISGGRARE